MPLKIPPTNPLLNDSAKNTTLQMKKSLEDLAIGQEVYGANKAVAWSLSGPRDLITGIAGTTLDAAQAGVQTVPKVFDYVMTYLPKDSVKYWLERYTERPVVAGVVGVAAGALAVVAGVAGVAAGALAVPASILYDAAHGVETIAKQGVLAGSRAVLEPLAKIAVAPLALTVTTFQNRNMRELMWASLKEKPANYTYTYDKLHEYQKKARQPQMIISEGFREIFFSLTTENIDTEDSIKKIINEIIGAHGVDIDTESVKTQLRKHKESLQAANDFAQTLDKDSDKKNELMLAIDKAIGKEIGKEMSNPKNAELTLAINKEMSNQFLMSIFGIQQISGEDNSQTIKKHIANNGLNTLFGKYKIDGDRISLTVPAEINWNPLNLIGVSYRTNADDLLLSDMSVIANYVKLQGKTEITMTLEYPGTGNREEIEKLQDVYLTKQFEASLHAGFAKNKIKLVLNGSPVSAERLEKITAAAVRNYGKQQEPIKDKEEDKDDNKQVDSTAAGGGTRPLRFG